MTLVKVFDESLVILEVCSRGFCPPSQARNMRLLERRDLGQCRVLVADSATNRVAPSAAVPSGDAGIYYMPRFSEVRGGVGACGPGLSGALSGTSGPKAYGLRVRGLRN